MVQILIISCQISHSSPLTSSSQGSEFLGAAAYKTLLDTEIQKWKTHVAGPQGAPQMWQCC